MNVHKIHIHSRTPNLIFGDSLDDGDFRVPRKADDLSPLAVAKLNNPGFHFVGHVAGLALKVNESKSRSWVLRAVVGSKRRDIGLGGYPEISLAKAKDFATEKRQQIRQGIDPVTARRAAREALKAEQGASITFKDAATQYIAAHEAGWKNVKHKAQWRSSLESYAYPHIGSMLVRDVGLGHITKIIEPMWTEKAETASRLRGRIESILDWATVRGFRTGSNPARWKGNLQTLLPARRKVAKIKHHAALDWQHCPAFMAELRNVDTLAAKALEFTILTACRSGEVRGATWQEIDLTRGIWTIPAERMKAGKEHRVPLPPTAIALLQSLPPGEAADLIFPSNRQTILSDMTLTAILRRMNKDFTVHGFRSTFRDWAGESTAFPREVIEHALAHRLKDKAEAAYARGDLFTKRAALMKAWAEYLAKVFIEEENITPIRKTL